MDNGPFSTFSALRAETRPHQVLYQASNLGRGEHVMRIKFEQPANRTRMGDFTIDFANLYTTRSLGGRPRNIYEDQAAPGTMQYVSKIPPSAIAGLSVSTAVAFFAVLSALYLWFRQRQRKMGDVYGDKKYVDLTE
ncbi:unnamed protein product [Cyclocybe aegerita]|uniref:Uncharacterized protein n=1 Tax=Cyclocybe aegerita TaxID=1973307 RepID=A0A8S0VQN5_CYCAE|nr:unnamed protein product [Cyclocybe aegerita]